MIASSPAFIVRDPNKVGESIVVSTVNSDEPYLFKVDIKNGEFSRFYWKAMRLNMLHNPSFAETVIPYFMTAVVVGTQFLHFLVIQLRLWEMGF